MSDIHPIAVPKWGIEMVEGTLNKWLKQPGDSISKGDEVFEMESDKIVNVWESPVDGVLRRQIAAEGDTAAVGNLLGVIATADVDDSAIDEFIGRYSGDSKEQATRAAVPRPAAVAQASGTAGTAGARRVNPVVRRLAEELNVDLGSVTGTGRNGRVTRDDIEKAAAGGGATASQDATANAGENATKADVQIIPLSATRKTTAKRLAQAKQEIPHYYLSAEYRLDGLLAQRDKLNNSAQQRISVNDLLVWCVARALMQVPEVNINLLGDEIHQFKHANVAVAIATDDGLYPATVYKADTLSPEEIASQTAALVEKANSNKLSREDISGGSFTVSNLGMFGVQSFSAIVNPPMCAILAMGRAEQRVVVSEGAPAVATLLSATLSCDHRAIDGALGARFLDALGAEISAL